MSVACPECEKCHDSMMVNVGLLTNWWSEEDLCSIYRFLFQCVICKGVKMQAFRNGNGYKWSLVE